MALISTACGTIFRRAARQERIALLAPPGR
jgi:hypothetical protein